MTITRFLLPFFVLLFYDKVAAQTLTLNDAVGNCLKANFDIKIQNKNAESAILMNNWGETGRLPTVTLNLSQNNSLNKQKPSNPFAIAGTNISDDARGSLDIQWTLFNGSRVILSKEKLTIAEKTGKINLIISIENAVQNVTNAYNKAFLEFKKAEVQGKILQYSRDKFRYAKTQADIGTVSSYDVLQHENNYMSDSVAFLNQKLALNAAFRDLNLAMSADEPNTVYTLSDNLGLPSDVPPLDTLYAKIDKNSAVRARLLAEENARNDWQLAKAATMPSVNLATGFSGNKSWFTADFPVSGTSERKRETRSGHNYGPYLNFTFSFPIFNGGKLQRGIQNSRLKTEIAALETQKQRLSIKRDIASAHELLTERKKIYEIASKNRVLAEKNLELSNERFQAGLINSFDYRLVQNNLLQATVVEVQSLFSLLEAFTTLSRLTGALAE
jgi:outer membrane protein TolC